MMESLGLLVEKAVESSIEKCPTFFDQLESSLEVAKPEIEKNLEKAEKFWDSLMSGENLGEAEPQVARLSDEEKAKIKEETGWSDEIIDSISSMEEAEIYKEAGLVETEIGGKSCLIRPDIDWEQKDQFGRTNAERAKQGLAPIDANGQPLELHHIGQHNDSPLAELTMQEHRGKGNDTILHDKSKESEIDRPSFGTERAEHWKERSGTEGVNGNE